jgi:hypothetical protein
MPRLLGLSPVLACPILWGASPARRVPLPQAMA